MININSKINRLGEDMKQVYNSNAELVWRYKKIENTVQVYASSVNEERGSELDNLTRLVDNM